jgi:hypothetical protein
MHGKIFTSAVFGVSLAWASALPAKADISLVSSSLRVGTTAGMGGGGGNGVSPASLPYFNDAHDILDVLAFSRTDYDFSASGDTGTFRFDFDHARTGIGGSYAQSDGQITITTTNDVHYSLDGFYNLTGSQQFTMFAQLRDVTDNNTIFNSVQVSGATLNESFTLGEEGGDLDNNLFGDISGTLLAGHTYQLEYNYFLLHNSPAAGPGATAVGDLNFNITPIPAPGAAVLAMVGLPIISWLKRRQTHCQPS